jgi:hypothetical protein
MTDAPAEQAGAFFYDTIGAGGINSLNNIIGALAFILFAGSILPLASLSTFQYERGFFKKESAGGLYPASAFFLSTVLLEGLCCSINGLAYGAIPYFMADFQGYVQAPNPLTSAIGYLGLVVLLKVVANVSRSDQSLETWTSSESSGSSLPLQACALCMSFVTPNQELAMVSAAAYVALSWVSAGVFVSYSEIKFASALQFLSFLKYPFQACLIHFFRDSPAVTPLGTPVMDYLVMRRFTVPDTILDCVFCELTLYWALLAVSFVALKYFYAERR